MSNLPSISRECNNNLTHVTVGAMSVSFSYSTPVAFTYCDEAPNGPYFRVVSENVWSMTTGKHLNAIDGGSKEAKAKRVPGALFERLLELVGKGDLKSLRTAQRLLDTHRGLTAAGVKASA